MKKSRTVDYILYCYLQQSLLANFAPNLSRYLGAFLRPGWPSLNGARTTGKQPALMRTYNG